MDASLSDLGPLFWGQGIAAGGGMLIANHNPNPIIDHEDAASGIVTILGFRLRHAAVKLECKPPPWFN